MGKGRGKGRKLNGSENHDDFVNGEEVKIPVQKKRGRPLKHSKEQQVRKMDNTSFINKNQSDDDLKKIKLNYNSKEKKEDHSVELVKEESADETKSSSIEEEELKTSGFGQNSRRRKNKPRRAAEAVVECC